jgi:hypothetical protein
MTMFTKTTIALCSAVALATALGSAAQAQKTSAEWQRAYQERTENGSPSAKHCIRGEESWTSAYPAWMVC